MWCADCPGISVVSVLNDVRKAYPIEAEITRTYLERVELAERHIVELAVMSICICVPSMALLTICSCVSVNRIVRRVTRKSCFRVSSLGCFNKFFELGPSRAGLAWTSD